MEIVNNLFGLSFARVLLQNHPSRVPIMPLGKVEWRQSWPRNSSIHKWASVLSNSLLWHSGEKFRDIEEVERNFLGKDSFNELCLYRCSAASCEHRMSREFVNGCKNVNFIRLRLFCRWCKSWLWSCTRLWILASRRTKRGP